MTPSSETLKAIAEQPLRYRFSLAVCALFAIVVGCHTWTPVRSTGVVTPGEVVEGRGDYTWSPERGWVRPSEGDWGPPAQVRGESLKAFSSDAYRDALEGFLHLEENLRPGDDSQPETHFYIGECYYQLGDYDDAVKHYKQVYGKGRPDEGLLNRTFQRVYEIAMDYLSGRAGQIFLFPVLATQDPDTGIELLLGDEGLLTQFPYLPFADDAIVEVAKYRYDSGDFQEAERLYRRVVTEYPGREWNEVAQFQLAMSVYKQIRGISYEQQTIVDAEREFRRYLDGSPRGSQAEAAREKLGELADLQGQSNLLKAKFYLRENQLAAAKLYLQIVIERYSRTTAADEARDIVRKIEQEESGS